MNNLTKEREALIHSLRYPWEEPDRSAEHEVQRLYKLCEKAADALSTPAVPAGYALVPVEPTIAMLMAGDEFRLSLEHPTETQARWAAMLAAAPQAAQPEPDDWQHLKQYGYAPGNYMSRCRTCGDTPVMDKRAITCRPCAEKKHAAAQQSEREAILSRLEAVPEPRKWNLYGTKHHWVRAGEFDDYRAAMLAAARGE